MLEYNGFLSTLWILMAWCFSIVLDIHKCFQVFMGEFIRPLSCSIRSTSIYTLVPLVAIETQPQHLKKRKSIKLQWRHNEHYGISNYWHLNYLLSCLFRCTSKKTSKLHITGLCEGNPHKGPIMWKMFPFDDVIMKKDILCHQWSNTGHSSLKKKNYICFYLIYFQTMFFIFKYRWPFSKILPLCNNQKASVLIMS